MKPSDAELRQELKQIKITESWNSSVAPSSGLGESYLVDKDIEKIMQLITKYYIPKAELAAALVDESLSGLGYWGGAYRVGEARNKLKAKLRQQFNLDQESKGE